MCNSDAILQMRMLLRLAGPLYSVKRKTFRAVPGGTRRTAAALAASHPWACLSLGLWLQPSHTLIAWGRRPSWAGQTEALQRALETTGRASPASF